MIELAKLALQSLASSPNTLALVLVAGGTLYLVRLLVTNTKITEALAARLQATHIAGIDTIKTDVKTVLERQGDVIRRLETLEDASARQASDLGTALTEIESLKRQTCGKASTCLSRVMHEECEQHTGGY